MQDDEEEVCVCGMVERGVVVGCCWDGISLKNCAAAWSVFVCVCMCSCMVDWLCLSHVVCVTQEEKLLGARSSFGFASCV